MRSSTRTAAFVGSLVLALGLAACGDDAGPQTYAITGVDYAFQGVPGEVAVGSTLTFTNGSDVEAHELVVVRLSDDSDLSVAELMDLPEEEAEAHFAPGPPAMVLVALPGEDGMAVLGDGTLTEPGRYALVCFIPTGADPDELLAAFESEEEGPPDIEGGPPHIVNGMYAELTVTE